jgi:hypothetical protein
MIDIVCYFVKAKEKETKRKIQIQKKERKKETKKERKKERKTKRKKK